MVEAHPSAQAPNQQHDLATPMDAVSFFVTGTAEIVGSIPIPSFCKMTAIKTRVQTLMDLFKLLMLSGQFWEEGPDMPIAMDYGCAVSISSTSFLIINKRDIREFDAAFESGKPTSNTNWKDSAT